MNHLKLNKINYLTMFFILMMISFSTLSKQSEIPIKDWKLVGKAELKKYFWKIYDSELLTQSGKYEGLEEPLALKIIYNRNISKQKLIDATVEQWKHLGYAQDQIDKWLPSMKDAWPDVEKGDILVYLFDQSGKFYYKAEEKKDITLYSQLNNRILSKAFIEIWLSPQTSYPKLRQNLISEEAK